MGYCQGPFGTWTERSPSEQGGVAGGVANFLPAAGGFVQALLHGYAGLRLLERSGAAGGGDDGEAAARLRLLPRCPPGVRGVRLRHVAFLGSQLALNYTTASMTVSLARSPPSGPRLVLVLPDDGKDWGSARRVPLVPGSAVTVPVQEAFIVGILEKEEGRPRCCDHWDWIALVGRRGSGHHCSCGRGREGLYTCMFEMNKAM